MTSVCGRRARARSSSCVETGAPPHRNTRRLSSFAAPWRSACSTTSNRNGVGAATNVQRCSRGELHEERSVPRRQQHDGASGRQREPDAVDEADRVPDRSGHEDHVVRAEPVALARIRRRSARASSRCGLRLWACPSFRSCRRARRRSSGFARRRECRDRHGLLRTRRRGGWSSPLRSRRDRGIDVRSRTATRASVSVDDVHELAPPLPGHVDEHGAAEPDAEVRADERERARQREDDPIAGNDACRSAAGRPTSSPASHSSATVSDDPGSAAAEASRRDAAGATPTRAGRRRSPERGQRARARSARASRASSARRLGDGAGSSAIESSWIIPSARCSMPTSTNSRSEAAQVSGVPWTQYLSIQGVKSLP